ncbi:MAG: translation elongation factor Ts [Alphaproteobacteria bacterium]|nr:translation elongation factor Ts [Alphaproteobacteria bacterium]
MSAKLVKELRERSGAGMMDCKRAIDETKGDMEAAIDWLRKKGLSQAAKKSGRVAAEGLIAVASNGTSAAVVELNSETDFVARNDQFQTLVHEVALEALRSGSDIEALKAQKMAATNKSVSESIAEAVATIGENMNLRRVATLNVAAGVVATYIHGAVKPGMGKIGVLVALESTGDAAKLEALGKQVAMHIAASNPSYITLESIPAEAKAREQEVSKTKAEKLFAEFVTFESGMAKYKDKLAKERNFSEKQFEPKLKELAQTLPNVDTLLADFDRQSVSEDRKEKADADKTKKLLNIFFEEAAFLLKKMRSYGDDSAIKVKLTELYYNETLRDSVLFEQVFVIDGKTKVGDVLANAAGSVGAPVALKAYTRFALGEGIEKAADDFAAEVAKVSGVA